MKHPEPINLYPESPLKFYKESDGSWSAVEENVIKNGWMYPELYYADIDKTQGGYAVKWNDNYKESHKFQDLPDAKQYVMLEYRKHKPHENAPKYQIDEE